MKHSDITVLVASNNKLQNDADMLEKLGYNVLPSTYDGKSTIDSITTYRPDVIVCDAFLPYMDFMGIINEVSSPTYNAVYILMFDCANDKLATYFMQSGGDYFFIRECSEQYLAKVIDSFVAKKLNYYDPETLKEIERRRFVEKSISEILKDLGMPSDLLGFNYVKLAVIFAFDDRMLLRSMSSGIYAKIASIFITNPSAVERAIRTAISVAWTRGDYEAQLSLFGYSVNSDMGKPTNKEFISKIVDEIKSRLAKI